MEIKEYLNVPIPILLYSLQERRTNEISLWLLLKFVSSGHFKLTRNLILRIKAVMRIQKTETITKYLDWLLRKGFLTYNSNSKSYRLVSMRKISTGIDSKGYIGCLMYYQDLKSYKEFAFSAYVKHLIRRGRNRAKRVGSTMRGTRMNRSQYSSSFYPIPNELLAEIFNKSIPWVVEIRKLAKEKGYLDFTYDYEKLGIPSKDIEFYKATFPEIAPKVKVFENEIAIQIPNIHSSNLVTRVYAPIKNHHC